MMFTLGKEWYLALPAIVASPFLILLGIIRLKQFHLDSLKQHAAPAAADSGGRGVSMEGTDRVAGWEAAENGFFAAFDDKVVFWDFDRGLVPIEWESDDEPGEVKRFLTAHTERQFDHMDELKEFARLAESRRRSRT
jgi:hypothetical protein